MRHLGNKSKDVEASFTLDNFEKPPTPLYQCQVQFENLIQNKDAAIKPAMVYMSSSESNRVSLQLREFKDNQKTLISFCIQVPS